MSKLSCKITIIITSLLSFVFVGDFAFAQNVAEEVTLTSQVSNLFELIIGVLSWLWVLLATLAGKLMTNDLIYGEFINLDNILKQLWNISKNFANYGLWFFFLYQIIRFFFQTGSSVSKIGTILWKILLGAIGIQASRFLVGATIDISTILTTAISSFPNTIIEQDVRNQSTIIDSIRNIPKRYDLLSNGSLNDPAIKASTEKLQTQENFTEEEILDFITPSPDSVSWPLMYVWFSALKIQEYMTLTLDAPSGEKPVSLMVTIFLKFGVLLAFTLALLILVVINIFRIMYLWLFIAFVPILILLRVFWEEDAISKGGIKHFSIAEVVKLIFTPVLYVAYLGIMLIAVVTMQKVMLGTTALDADNCNRQINGVTLCYDQQSKASSINLEDIDSGVTIEGEIFPESDLQDAASNLFTSLLITVFTLLLLWGLVYLMTSSGSEVGRSYANKARQTASTIATSIPIVPFAWGQSINSLQQGAQQARYDFEKGVNAKNNEKLDQYQAQIDRYLWFSSGGLQPSQLNEIQRIASQKRGDFTWNTSRFLTETKDALSSLDSYSLQANDGVAGHIDTWFTTNRSRIQRLFATNGPQNNTRIFAAFQQNTDANTIKDFAAALQPNDRREFLTWLHQSLGSSETINTHQEFLTKQII